MEKLTLAHLVRKFYVFYDPRKLLTFFTKVVISPSPFLRHVFSLHRHNLFT